MLKDSFKTFAQCFVAILLGVFVLNAPVYALEWDDPDEGRLKDKNNGLIYVLNDDASCYVCDCSEPYAQEIISIPQTIQWEGLTYTVASIGEEAFAEISKIEKIILPDTITTIGSYAFRKMLNLTTLVIPRNVRDLGIGIVDGCTSLTELSVNDANPYFCSDSVGCIYNKDKSKLLCVAPVARIITIPEGVTQFAENAISGNNVIEEITIPSTVDTIPNGFFSYCGNLKKVILNVGVKKIEQKAFNYCTSLEYVKFPEGLTHIGNGSDVFSDGVFVHCDNLKEVTLPNSMEFICRNAFFFCENLKKVTIYSRNATIEEFAFSDCHSNLTIYGYYGSTIQQYAETGWCSFKVLDKPAATGSVLKDASAKCEVKVVSSSESNPTVAYVKPTNKSAKSIMIPDTVKVDGITYKVISVASKAFKNNKKLNSVTIGKYVKKIGTEAFSGCKNLKKVTIGKSVTTIGTKAFYNCKKMKTIIIESSVLKSVGKSAIKNIDKKATIKVPKKQLSKYKKLFKSKTGYKKTMKIKK